ncbi:MAG TPA: GtrA family protein [Bacteroidales bacterium]|nr:GtrA family protein [Bacteroidales bacterium]HNS47757.1 GtrA family protein [Bacteroidales bacterium]
MSELLKWEVLIKFFKFGVVGVSGIAVDFGMTYLCKEVLKIQKYVSNAIGFTTAASTNYLLNRIWTFQSTDPAIFLQYSRFLMISLIGLGINTLVLWILVSRYHKRFYLSKLAAVAVVMIWNFLANYFFTFQG